ncbi:molybdopterin-dependent oxidoreductase [Flexivirga lutea]
MPSFFPWWVVVTHFLNLFFMVLLFRSGLEVLSAFPKLYWHDDCPPGREWLRLSKKMYGADSRRPWTSLDEEEPWSPAIAMPGRKNLGLGRHWHFLTIQFWILTGVVYVVLVFATGYWHYLIPSSWEIVPDSIRAVGTYLQFKIPAKIPGQPFEPAQKLVYFLVIFVLAPVQIASGAAMSPSVLARFPWYGKIFGGKQGARSVHFLGLCAFAVFVVIHVFMVIVNGLPHEFTKAVLAGDDNETLALWVGFGALFFVLAVNVAATIFSLHRPRATQRALGWGVNPFEKSISRAFTSREHYAKAQISPFHRVNGYPPVSAEYNDLARNGFADYQLDVGGLVERPVSLSLRQLRALGTADQITKHQCIQGWSAVAQWSGVPLSAILELVEPTADAKHVVFYAWDDKGLTEGEGRYGYFYGTIPLHLATNPQSILALEMNGAPLPIEHGAPIRVRLETQLGFKMVKWVRAIEFVSDVSDIGQGQGGWREDQQYYANAAGI